MKLEIESMENRRQAVRLASLVAGSGEQVFENGKDVTAIWRGEDDVKEVEEWTVPAAWTP